MKQLIEIEAIHLKEGDLIFDFKSRDLTKIDYVSKESKDGGIYLGIGEIYNIQVSYGIDCDYTDNFKPNTKVLILVDTENIKIKKY